jgi:monoamine oxidase
MTFVSFTKETFVHARYKILTIKIFDTIIVGGGACGLMAAYELCLAGKKVAVIEAAPNFGGRIRTIMDPSFDHPVEAGAEFIHGKMPLTMKLLKQTGTRFYKAEGDIWKHNGREFFQQEDFIENMNELEEKLKLIKEDLPLEMFLHKYFPEEKWQSLRSGVRNYIEGYDAANLDKASTLGFKNDMLHGADEQFRIEGGYNSIIEFLYKECLDKGCSFFPSEPVSEIVDHEEYLRVKTIPGNEFRSSKLIITVSLGVLRENLIRFEPELPEKTEAARKLGFGAVIKMVYNFKIPFWKETGSQQLKENFYLFSDETIPTWWKLIPSNTLTAWVGGPPAEKLRSHSDEEIRELGILSLSNIFKLPYSFIKEQLSGTWVTNWFNEPYCLGGYSYEVIKGDHYKAILREPVHNRIFFAGEALQDSVETGTVEAALVSGRETAHRSLI